MSRETHARRIATPASIMVMVAAGVFVMGAPPASALPGYEVVQANSAEVSKRTRVVVARCPTEKRLVGGSGLAIGPFFNAIPTLTLTELRPLRRRTSSGRDGYLVRAAETGAGTSGRWVAIAYAVCVDRVAVGPWSIRTETTTRSSSSVKSTAAVCPAGRRVLGTGASIKPRSRGQVFLQVIRPSRPGDIARAQGHEDATGYGGRWSVSAYAICAPPPPGYVIPPFARSVPLGGVPTGSDSQVIADRSCPDGKQVLSAGAALGSDAPGNVSLQGMFPTAGFTGSQALAAENAPTEFIWDFMVASSICAS